MWAYSTDFQTLAHINLFPKMMSLARYGTVTKAEIEIVSRATVAGLKSCGLTSCLVGGAACMTYGMTRVPNVSITAPLLYLMTFLP